mmetsp:Transcript_6929/g.9704  ORF Transcript_6929/g.9704 Transcript_6929/m.9704 type:complete len:152 (-) Transcript_6929:1355-1810(-)
MRHLATLGLCLCASSSVQGLRMAAKDEEIDEEELAALDEDYGDMLPDFDYDSVDYGDEYMMYGDEMVLPPELMELLTGGAMNDEMLETLFGGADVGEGDGNIAELLAALGIGDGENLHFDDPSSVRLMDHDLLDEDDEPEEDEFDFPDAEL